MFWSKHLFRASSPSREADNAPLDESSQKVLKTDERSREQSEEVGSAVRSSGGPDGRTNSSKAINLGDIEPEMLFERAQSDTPLALKLSARKQVGQGVSPGKGPEEAKAEERVSTEIVKKATFAKPEPLFQEEGEQHFRKCSFNLLFQL